MSRLVVGLLLCLSTALLYEIHIEASLYDLALHPSTNSPVCGMFEPYFTLRVKSKLECSVRCEAHVQPRCVSFNYRQDEESCELFVKETYYHDVVEGCVEYQNDGALKPTDHQLKPLHDNSDCAEILQQGPGLASGMYNITIANQPHSTSVYCDMTTDGGGWTMIQRRTDGLENFNRSWAEYGVGFGSLMKEFWLGNEYIHALTVNNGKTYVLRIEMTDWEGNSAYALYDTFKINDLSDNYRLTLGTYSGTAGSDSFADNNGCQFSTYDSDHDGSPDNCAVDYGSGWWHQNCYFANLNGPRNYSYPATGIHGMVWTNWIGSTNQLQTSVMLIRAN